MKAILVLTDFSAAAGSAVSYACILSEQLKTEEIILFHSYQIPIPVSEASVFDSSTDENNIRQTAVRDLENLELQVRKKISAHIAIRHRTDTSALGDINNVAQEEGAELIVMGTTGKSKLQEIILGSNAITVCKSSKYPVVLVPPHVSIQPARQIAFACDMKEVEKTIPVASLKKIVDEFNLPLNILNVDDEDKHFTAEMPLNAIKLYDMLTEYNPGYYNINNENVVGGIIEFAKHEPATLVLLISKRHNFMEGLFYRSLTRKLAYVTPFPLLVLREKEQQ